MKSNAMEAGLAACHGDGAAYPVDSRAPGAYPVEDRIAPGPD